MNFGLFLLKNNVINVSTLLDSVQAQYETLPSLIKILRQELKVGDQEILDLLKSQEQGDLSLLEAIKKNTSISDEVLQNAISSQNQKIKTIGEILIDNNLVDIKIIQEQVDAYLGQKDAGTTSEAAPASPTPAPTSAPPSDDEPEVSQAAIDSMSEIFGADSEEVKELQAKLHASTKSETSSSPATPEKVETKSNTDDFFAAKYDLDPDFVNELIFKFNAREIVDLSKAIKSLHENTEKAEALNEIKKKFHTILGAAKLSGAKIMSTSILAVEEYLNKLDPNTLVESDMEKLYQFFSLLVKLRNHIEQEKSEKEFFQESNRQELYENLKANII